MEPSRGHYERSLQPVTPPIETIVKKIVERFNPLRIILFGSRARGDTHPDSDLDLIVEMETVLSPPRRSSAIAALFSDRTWPLDVLVYTPREAAHARADSHSFLSQVESEGRVVYERG